MCLFTNCRSYNACIMVLPLYSFDLPFFLHNCIRWRFCSRHVMASVWYIKIAKALLILCLAYYVMKQVQHCRNWGIMAFMYRDMGRAFHKHILHIFLDGLQRCFSCCSLLILLCSKQNITEYEAYWLMGVPIINPCSFHEHILCIFCNGWMDCKDAFHAVLCLYILLCYGQTIAE